MLISCCNVYKYVNKPVKLTSCCTVIVSKTENWNKVYVVMILQCFCKRKSKYTVKVWICVNASRREVILAYRYKYFPPLMP